MSDTTRRSFLAKGIASAVCIGGLPHLLRADDTAADELVTTETRQAIRLGLNFLAAGQLADGGFGTAERVARNVGVSALCGMALLESGQYKANVAQAVGFICAQQREDGLIVAKEGASHGPMYGHAFATQFLAERVMSNPIRDATERTTLQKAVDLIVASQNDEGGWRYLPTSKDADISMTACQIVALWTAKDAGVPVKKETLERATNYVKGCQNEDGGFRYQFANKGSSLFPRSAAAMSALYLAEVDQPAILRLGREYLLKSLPTGKPPQTATHYFYGQYYAARAMRHARGEHWTKWYPAIRDELLKLQKDGGRWADPLLSDEYGTAMACLVLQAGESEDDSAISR